MSLVDYRHKRHFSATPEPQGAQESKSESGSQYVIQKHAASHLHYDFRLELDGTLKSWAVPHGPCLDPSQKRLAVQVEDHPVEYGGFEGTIPEGQYGGGTVIIWDRGTWQPIGNPATGLREGKLKFVLDGEKLHGAWNLIRMKFKSGGKESWLLIKEKDDAAVAVEDSDILVERPESVVSGKTIEEAAGAQVQAKHAASAAGVKPESRNTGRSQNHQRNNSSGVHSTDKKTRSSPNSRHSKSKPKSMNLPDAVKSDFPRTIEPQLATLVDVPPEGANWLHEVKFDGYRVLCYLDNGKVTLYSRNQLDWTVRFSELAAALRTLPVRQAVLDGELVALLPDGTTNFQELQVALTTNHTNTLKYYAFDLLYLDGYDLRQIPLELRKEKLRELIPVDHPDPLRYSIEFEGTGKNAFQHAVELGLEGIVSKRKDRTYQAGRSGDWQKIKSVQQDEFVIGGFTDSTSSRKKLGALLLGVFDDAGHYTFAGKVGTGFSEQTLRDLHKVLHPLEQKANPFAGQNLTGTLRGIHWVRPEIVAQIGYSNWTRDGRLRHPTFLGLREDKAASAVHRDRPRKIARVASSEPESQSRARTVRENNGAKSKRGATMASVPTQQSKTSKDESRQVELTHPDRVVYPSELITKQDLANYYAAVAAWILPHVENRPLSLLRCPEGQGGTSFFQKHMTNAMPVSVERILISEKNKSDYYLMIRDLSGLTSLVQFGVMEIHPWGSRADNLERPDRMIFDLDPDPSIAWREVVKSARELKQRLQDLGLESFVKTTGGKGLHVVVPLARRNEWADLKEFSKAIAQQMAADSPDRFTAVMSKAARHGKIFVDYLRNDRGATAVAPYSTRAREGAPVATPLSWDELSDKVKPIELNLKTVPDRLASLQQDPWKEISSIRQSLTAKMKNSVGL
ncbi:MAG: putative ligase-like protein [Planctomycetaceae bacterium]|nr:putative ligase-like protein [Planctomycetaceae bacterium]